MDTRKGDTMSARRLTSAQEKARDMLGPRWRGRVGVTLCNLVDLEAALHEAAAGANDVGSALAVVCDALRDILEPIR